MVRYTVGMGAAREAAYTLGRLMDLMVKGTTLGPKDARRPIELCVSRRVVGGQPYYRVARQHAEFNHTYHVTL